MNIIELEKNREYTQKVYDCIKTEWGTLDILNYLKLLLGNEDVSDIKYPKVLIAISNSKKFLGTISILENDMDNMNTFNPWLGCLYVNKNFRKKGIAKKLFLECELLAQKIKIKKLYLFTSKIEKIAYHYNWQLEEKVFFENETVSVMSKIITRHN